MMGLGRPLQEGDKIEDAKRRFRCGIGPGRPGHPGFEEFRRIAAEWGYP